MTLYSEEHNTHTCYVTVVAGIFFDLVSALFGISSSCSEPWRDLVKHLYHLSAIMEPHLIFAAILCGNVNNSHKRNETINGLFVYFK